MFVALPDDPGDTRRRFPYVASLDGIRGLIVFPVLVFHFTVAPGDGLEILAPGSFLGPSMFFTLSGFLICSLLLAEGTRGGRIDWVGFWRRRFRRLLPASMTVVVAVALIQLVRPETWSLRTVEALAGLFSFKNWQDIAYAASTTDNLRTLGPLSPYWSLSIEEQFYLGMSIVVGLSMVSRRWVGWMTAAFALLAVGSVCSMVLVDSTLNREFFGTDSRAAELLAGCLLAIAVFRRGWPRSPRWGWLGWACLAATLWGWAVFREDDAWLLRGGLSAWGLVNCGMIVGALSPASSFARAFAFRPLVEIGKISYSLYVSHWPVNLAIRPGTFGLEGWSLFGARFAVSFLVAVPLAYLIEEPIRRRRVLRGRSAPAVWATTVLVIVGLCSAAN